RQQAAVVEVVLDLAEQPGPSARGASDHHGIGTGQGQYGGGLLWRVDVAVGEQRDVHHLADGADGVVFGFAAEQVAARASVYGEGLDAGGLREAGDTHAVAVACIPASADLQGHRYVHGCHHGVEDAPDENFVTQQRGTGCLLHDLLHRAAHVDVDDFGAVRHIQACCFGHCLRVAAGDLHTART